MEWSLWARDVEDEVVPVCRELGIGIVAYSPLGRPGLLVSLLARRPAWIACLAGSHPRTSMTFHVSYVT